MNKKLGLTLVSAVFVLAACDKQNKTVDRFWDSHSLSDMNAGVWIDPNGCDHWIIDDGFEGYLSQRLDKYGKPVCSGIGQPNTAVGDFKKSSDPI